MTAYEISKNRINRVLDAMEWLNESQQEAYTRMAEGAAEMNKLVARMSQSYEAQRAAV